MKSLAKETAIYGISSIVGKFLNWMLVPLYTYTLKQSADYGIVTNLYAWTALLLVILTYGMETGFFRFANDAGENAKKVYSTTLLCLLTTSTVFGAVCVVCSQGIADILGYPDHREFIAMLGVVVAMDAFSCTPFSYLRFRKKALQFALYKLLFVGLNIFFNLLFLVVCPKLQDWSIVNSWYDADYGVGYVFVANILATGIQTLCLLPTILEAKGGGFDRGLLKKMLRYSLPLLVLGVAGIMNQTLDRIIFPWLYTGVDAQDQLGIYGACFKVAMVMMMFTQAFRYAYEPYVFSKHKDKKSVGAYADAMKYYVIFSYLILIGMTVYLDLLKYIIAPSYWAGLRVVPIVLWTYIFQGIYFNLSFWYKLTDKTQYGAYFSLLGLLITAALQVWLVPKYSYMASAGANTVCYFVIMLLSYFIGKKYLEVPYDLKSIGGYTLLTICLLGAFYGCKQLTNLVWLQMLLGTGLIAIYLVVLTRKDFPMSSLPVVGKYFR